MSQSNKEFDLLEFASQTSKFIETHFKKALALFAVIVIAASLWAYTKNVQKKNEREAFGELYSVTKIYNDIKEEFDQAEAAKDELNKDGQKKKDNKDKDLKAASGDLDKDYGEVVTKLEAFIKDHTDKNAAGEAALLLSEIYGNYDKPEKGAEALSQVMGKWNNKNVLYYIMQMRAGDLWASSDQCEKAVSYWQVVANSESFIKDQAQLKLGVCLQKVGRLEEAKKWFEKIKANSPESTEGFSAKRYLRFLEFKTKNSDSGDSNNKAQKNQKDEEKKS